MAAALVILTFTSTHRAIAAEEALLEADVPHQIVPLPAWVRAGCGLSLRLEAAALDRALAALEQAGAAVEAVHTLPDGEATGSES
jgi:hypothetical protein